MKNHDDFKLRIAKLCCLNGPDIRELHYSLFQQKRPPDLDRQEALSF